MTSLAMKLDDLVRATPQTRDRYIDFLRAASILVVVVGHWLMLLLIWEHGVIRSVSVIGQAPGLWLATWLLQVMPIFFFVGGYANLVAYQSALRRAEPVSRFLRNRMRRLLIPSLVFVAVWTVVQLGLHLASTGAPTAPRFGEFALLRGVRPPGQTIPFGPLWFLVVYLGVVALCPVTIALHRRFRWSVLAAMLIGAVSTDLVGIFGGHPGMRFGNVVFVLFLPHQLGYFYADGSIRRWPRSVAWWMVTGGLVGMVALTNPWLFEPFSETRFDWFPRTGHYPRSLLGTDVGEISNAYPPTLVYLLVGAWLIGLALLVRPTLDSWLLRPRPWRLTVLVNSRIMTLFLWHMTAYLIAVIMLWPLGFGQSTEPTLRWWAERPVWVLVPGMILLALVVVFGRFEARGRPPAKSAATPMAEHPA